MTVLFGELCLTGSVVAPLVGAVVSAAGGRACGRGHRAAAGLAWMSAVLALVTAVLVALRGPFVVALHGGRGQVLLGLWADQLTVALVALVCVVGAVVQSFSLRYLQGDRTARRFFAGANVVVAAMAVVCTSATLAALVAGWVAAGAAFVVVLGCRPDLPGVREATRRAARMFVLGDSALVVALVLVWVRAGNVDLASPGDLQAAVARVGDLGTPVALLVVVAVLTRSAQGLLGRWLPSTVSAPTPTSALLHAGVVNGGGILLVRLGVLAGGSLLAMVGVFAVAGVTAAVATQAMTHKPDVKGALVFSTMSQMGFMVAECAVGAYLAAVVHLIGHALYKATLFFGSGSQVPRPGEAPVAPPAVAPGLTRSAAAAAAAAVTVATMAAVPGVLAHRGAFVLLAFAAGTAASASWSWWGRPPASRRGAVLWATALVGASALYGLVLDGLGRWIGPSLPAAGTGVLSPWWLTAVVGAGVAAAALTRLPSAQQRLTAILVDGAAPPLPFPARARRGPGRTKRVEAPGLAPALEGLWDGERSMNSDEPAGARVRLLAQVEEAARVVAPLWPLSTCIAVNPLWDLRQMPFHEAVEHAGQVLGIRGYPPLELFAQAHAEGRVTAADLRAALDGDPAGERSACRSSERGDGRDPQGSRTSTAAERHDRVLGTRIAATVDREVAKWCAAYIAGILPDESARGFYAAWRQIVAHDPAPRSLVGRAGRKRLAGLGADAEEAILTSLDLLGVPEDRRASELASHLARMPGWAGHAKWRSRWAAREHPGVPLHLVDYLAVRLCYEAVFLTAIDHGPGSRSPKRRPFLGGSEAPEQSAENEATREEVRQAEVAAAGLPEDVQTALSRLDATEAAGVWLAAYEGHYRDWLLQALDRHDATRERHPAAQAVFCIDTRSERLRRHLEAAGPYETFGFAGFFALPIRYRAFGSAEAVDLCPVLIRPSTEIAEQPPSEPSGAARRHLAGRQVLAGARGAFDNARKGAVSQFVLAEAGGFIAGPIAVAKTIAPSRYQAARRWAQQVFAPPVATYIDAEPAAGGMSDEEQALFAEAALTTMGLTRSFASVVLLCGHGSTTENNPHASALDCGACGGNRGGPSARAAAAILNRQATRRLLAERGIVVPDETVFVAGEHDTATDTVTVLDTHLVPPSHREAVAALQSALERAGAATAAERRSCLPGGESHGRSALPRERAADWAQVRPEWGLARNAAFIVAPRAATAGVDLEGRCFLHSYDPGVDPDGVALETILTAPMVVAHWINAQYYFSTVDPAVLSAGDKTAHNIVAGIGVVQGAGRDLRVGLPLQSLYDGERAYHEPMRLLVVVQAPLALLETVIARNPVLRELFDGRWVHLAAREDPSDSWKIRRPDGTWDCWSPAAARSKEATVRG
jgi:uncharacterized protein YbcC (UPF0753/DUF2309 family)/NADH:ubiquinone oxidoreductase subunit 5 (subunit L)/multisubunit Na+/H+ antiporter MnhA subunit